MEIAEIAFSESAVDSIDTASDKFQEHLSRVAKQIALGEGLLIVYGRHILEAYGQLIGQSDVRTESGPLPNNRPSARSSRSPLTPTSTDWPTMPESNSKLPNRQATVETVTLKQTLEQTVEV